MSLFNRDCNFKLRYATHGILGISLGGKKGSSTSAFSEKEDETVKKRQTTGTTSTGTARTTKAVDSKTASTGTQKETGQTLSDQLSTVTNLDAETQALIQNLLGSLSGGSDELVQAQQARALGTEDRLAGITDAIVANAQAQGEEDVGQLMQGFARSAGSSQNTIVQQLGLKESSRVNREIADLAATLGIQTDEIATTNINEAVGESSNLIAQLANVLKGAESTTATTASQTNVKDIATALQEILASSETGAQTTATTEQQIINALVEGSKTASGSGSGRSKEIGGGLSFSL